MKINENTQRLTAYSVLVVSANDSFYQFIESNLSHSRYSPVYQAKSGAQARNMLAFASYDVVIINSPLPDEFGNELAIHITDTDFSGVIMVVKGDIFEDISYGVESQGVIAVSKPLSRQSFLHALSIVTATRERLRRLESENKKLHGKVDEMRIVSRAKCVLIEYLKMSEQEAHRYIEKQAMDMRVMRSEIAENIIKTYES